MKVIIDEVQREPEALSWVQVFTDGENTPGQFILTGSNQPELGEAVSQSLAGRTSIHYLLPLSIPCIHGLVTRICSPMHPWGFELLS